ncbi:hypothetical protein Hte_001291 [Hypoxylon texense]
MNEPSSEPANRGEDAKATALNSSKSAVYLEAARPELSSLHFGFLSVGGPIGVVSLLLFYLLWPKPQALPDIERRSWKGLDYVGSILLIAGSVLVVFPFQDAGSSPDQWSKAIFIGPLVVGAVSWLGLFVWSIFVERSREDTVDVVLPMRLMRNPVYMGAALNTLCLGFPYMLIIYAFPLRLRVVDGKDAFTAGVMLLPMLGPSALGSMIAGMVNGKKIRIFEMLFAGGCLTVLGCALLTTISSTYDAEAKTLGFLAFVGLGFGMSVSTSTMVATTHCSARDHALVQGIIAQVRVLGGSLGIAASSAIVGSKLQEQVGSAQISYTPGAKSSDAVMTQDHQIAIRQAYSDAFNECMRVCAFIGGVAALVAFATYNRERRDPSEQHMIEESSGDEPARPWQAPAT